MLNPFLIVYLLFTTQAGSNNGWLAVIKPLLVAYNQVIRTLMETKIDKILAALPEIGNWIAIFISPTIIGGILGLVIRFWLGGKLGLILGIIIFILGIFLGIRFAEWARKKEGTNNFMTRLISTTPAKDEEEKET